MKSLISSTSVLILVLATFTALAYAPWSSGIKTKTDTLRVGVAKINITPGTPLPMSGYGARDSTFQSVHDSLFAFAVVFDDGTQKAALVTADLIGFSNSFCEQTAAMIEKATGIPKAKVMISATHTHGGPVNNTYGTSEDPGVTAYVSYLQNQIVKAVTSALKKLAPSQIGAGEGRCTMNVNRRAPFADGSIWLGRNPEGPCDHSVSVLKINDLEGSPIAVLANWATHGTVGGQENYHITGDWPGAASRFVEDMIAEGVIAPITVGASGDIAPIYGPNDRFKDIDAIGKILADEIVEVAESINTYEGGLISTAKRTIVAKGREPTDNHQPNQSLVETDPVEINLTVIKVGGVVFAGISGEVMTEIGMAIKQKSSYSQTVVVTHCNGSAGYLLTDAAYSEGGYEAKVSRTMPGTAGQIIDNLDQMIRSLP